MKTEEEQKWENAMRAFLVRNNPLYTSEEIEEVLAELLDPEEH
jgi:hypothetical protein